MLEFWKYQATGNDFIMLDRMDGAALPDMETIKALCRRRTGIGSDGLIIIQPHATLDLLMNFYNPDGTQSFCGNGARATIRFAVDRGYVKDTLRFEAIDGPHEGRVEDGIVKLRMSDVVKAQRKGDDLVLDTGSPHYIRFVDVVEEQDLVRQAHVVRYSPEYASKGINVNLVERHGDNSIRMRTYERGVEGETLSCGTGVTAAALAVCQHARGRVRVDVETRGGRLNVDADMNMGDATDVWLEGPATMVFKGQIGG